MHANPGEHEGRVQRSHGTLSQIVLVKAVRFVSGIKGVEGTEGGVGFAKSRSLDSLRSLRMTLVSASGPSKILVSIRVLSTHDGGRHPGRSGFCPAGWSGCL